MTGSISSFDASIYNLNAWCLPLETAEDITKIVSRYQNLGINLNLTNFIEITINEPEIKAALQGILDFIDFINSNTSDLENTIEKFSRALALGSAIGNACQLPILKQLADVGLIYILYAIVNHGKLNSQIDFIALMLAEITEEPLFIALSLELQKTRAESDSVIVTQIDQVGINIVSNAASTLHQQKIDNINLLQLFKILSIRIQDLNVTICGIDNKELAIVWQDLTEKFLELQINITRKKLIFTDTSNAKEPSSISDDVIEPQITATTQPQILIESDPVVMGKKVIANLTEHGHLPAAEELQDLLSEVEILDHNYADLIMMREQQVTLPKILFEAANNNNIAIANKFAMVEFVVTQADSRIKITINASNQAAYSGWQADIHLAVCPRTLLFPGFNGKISLNKYGDLVIKELPKNLNYNFIVDGNLHIEHLKINGRLKIKALGTIFNHRFCTAAGGIWLLATKIDNTKGVFSTFNSSKLPCHKLNKLSNYLAKYRLITLLLNQSENNQDKLQVSLNKISAWFKKYGLDVNSGKIQIYTQDLYNYYGNILSGDCCAIHSNKLNTNHGTIASHGNKLKVLNIADDGAIICGSNGSLWAAKVLQATAAKITKDDTSIVIGVHDTILRRYLLHN